MAYVSIPKDLTQVHTKFLLGLSKRQTVCFGAAAATGVPLFFLTRGILPTSAAAFLMVVVMLPWFMFAMYQRNGQPLEKYLKCIYMVHFKRPKIRTYQTNNLYTAIVRQVQLDREVQDIVSKKSMGKVTAKAIPEQEQPAGRRQRK
jgi:hypothetical protein